MHLESTCICTSVARKFWQQSESWVTKLLKWLCQPLRKYCKNNFILKCFLYHCFILNYFNRGRYFNSGCNSLQFYNPSLELFTKKLEINQNKPQACIRLRFLILLYHNSHLMAAKGRPLFLPYGLWTRRDLYSAAPVETRGVGLFGLIRQIRALVA